MQSGVQIDSPSGPKSGGPRVLVVSADPALRRQLEDVVAERESVLALGVDALRETARLLDAVAVVAVLSGTDGPAGLDALSRLGGLPAGRRCILLAHDVPESLLDSALSRLQPVQVLIHPCPPSLLWHALTRAVPPPDSGRGARAEFRPAETLLGVSAAIREVLAHIDQFAPTDVPVLILGETGTGKELVARAVHQKSRRATGPFVAINCGALPDTLLESELFGHCRGAFTGADRETAGLFEQANGGTLFLDEIGETSPALQVKLLRAIETGELRPVGGTTVRHVDVRVVSATHRQLDAMIEAGEFRQDLLYRLNTAMLHVPPLRRRRVDIPFLAQHFAEQFGGSQARRITLDEGFVEALSRHDFPGNVRELRNAVERAIALAGPDEPVGCAHLPPGMVRLEPPAAELQGTLRERFDQVERAALQEALRKFDGNRTHAAGFLGLSRQGLRQKMGRHGLR